MVRAIPRPLTWTCHVCGKRRPDAKISVYSLTRPLGHLEVKFNARYCNDRQACKEGVAGVARGWADSVPAR